MEESALRGVVKRTIREFLPHVSEDAIGGHLHLSELGADSVERVEIIMALVDVLDVRVPLAAFSEIPNVDGLVRFLAEVRRG